MANKRIKQILVGSTTYDIEAQPIFFVGDIRTLTTPGVYIVGLEEDGYKFGAPALKSQSIKDYNPHILYVTKANASNGSSTNATHTMFYDNYLYTRTVDGTTADNSTYYWYANINSEQTPVDYKTETFYLYDSGRGTASNTGFASGSYRFCSGTKQYICSTNNSPSATKYEIKRDYGDQTRPTIVKFFENGTYCNFQYTYIESNGTTHLVCGYTSGSSSTSLYSTDINLNGSMLSGLASKGASTGGATPSTSTASAHKHSVTIESATVELQPVSIPTVSYTASTRNLTFGTTVVNAVCTTGATGTATLDTTNAGSHSHTVNSHTHIQQ